MIERRNVRRGQSGQIARRDPAESGQLVQNRRERVANVIDRYSLALQIIQVFPIISESVVFAVASTWLGRLLSGLGLLAGTIWVIQLDRARGRRKGRRNPGAVSAQPTIPAQLGRILEQSPFFGTEGWIRQDDTVIHAEMVGETGEINILIRLNPMPSPSQSRGVPESPTST